MSTTELVAKLRSTKSESKRKLLDEAADTIERLEAERNELAIAALREREELADLIEAKNEGRLVVLPCKLGADIFRLGAKEVCAHWQTAYAEVYPDEIVMVDDSDNLIFIEDIGKTVFLTREEAEKALKEDA